ncbi:MAG TPA: hypothetical protein VGE74_10630 [Gemmata sp.]
MSERAAAFGALAPPKTIEHKGRVYTIAPVLTQGTLLAVEERMYQRAKDALVKSRELYTSDEYSAERAKLRSQYETGGFAFESAHGLEFMQTVSGAVLLLGCMMDAEPAEILELLTAKPEELETALNEALEASFPSDRRPKVPPPSQKVGGKKPNMKRV